MKAQKQVKQSKVALSFHYQILGSPVGSLLAVASSTALVFLEFGKDKAKLDRVKHKLQKWHKGSFSLTPGSNKILRDTEIWLKHYFSGNPIVSRLPPLNALGTPFEKAIWRAMKKIPRSSVWSYKDLAKKAGYPKGARAAGGACGRNPISILVPCHRVVGSSGKLTGYGGGLPTKQWLLDHERASQSVV